MRDFGMIDFEVADATKRLLNSDTISRKKVQQKTALRSTKPRPADLKLKDNKQALDIPASPAETKPSCADFKA